MLIGKNPLSYIKCNLFIIFLILSLFGCVEKDKKDFDSSSLKVGTVVDIYGNEYDFIRIGDQDWMSENLRVSRYNDGTEILSGLSNEEWEKTKEGAYSIYSHEIIEGIDSEENMLESYGKLYNWYAVSDDRGLCPEGWRVPVDEDWLELTSYLVENYKEITNENVANALKSCRQVDTPLEGKYDTDEHPRWDADDINDVKRDKFGFSALPGGLRDSYGEFQKLGHYGIWWSANEEEGTWGRYMTYNLGNIFRSYGNKSYGFSVRCVRNVEE